MALIVRMATDNVARSNVSDDMISVNTVRRIRFFNVTGAAGWFHNW